MKIEIKNETTETIDWSKPQILMSLDGKSIVLTNGKSTKVGFEGYALNYGDYINTPHFYNYWDKKEFEPYKGILKLSNE